MIREFIQSEKIDPEKGPTQWHFDQLDKITSTYNENEVCCKIFEEYDPAIDDRHQVANLLSMLIWVSADYDLAVSAFFKQADLNDKKIIGVLISKELGWYPFSTPEKTVAKIKKLKIKFPEYNEDYTYWEKSAKKE